jgi:hypothetical protein
MFSTPRLESATAIPRPFLSALVVNTFRKLCRALVFIAILTLAGCGGGHPAVDVPEHPGPKPKSPPIDMGAPPMTPKGMKPPKST